MGFNIESTVNIEKTNNSVVNNSITNTTLPIEDINSTNVTIPSNDQIISLINWSKYPIIKFSCISKSMIEGPNTIINYTFLDVHINVIVNDPDNVLEVYNELSSIVKAEKALIGPCSSIQIFGYIEDGRVFIVEMLPYDTTIYRSDYIHPINNLTWSKIDASEVD